MDTVVEFEPRELSEARQRTQHQHPGTATRPAVPNNETISHLRQRVLLTEGVPRRIHRLSEKLSPRELRGIIGGIARWEDLRPWCAQVVRHRLSPRLLAVLWSSWQRRPEVQELKDLLLEGGRRLGWDRVVPAPYVGTIQNWVESPAVAIQQWLDDQGLSFSDLSNLVGRPIGADTPLARLVRDSILTRGSRAQLSSEAENLTRWERELSPEKAILFGQNYLRTMPDPDWSRPLLDRIRDRFGIPRKPTVQRFWEKLSPEIQEAFQRLYIERRIQEELGHDDDRERFWRRWASEMVDLNRGTVAAVRFAEIDFGGFVVFEFFETGNAAYFYTPEDARALKAKSVSSPRDLKERKYYGFSRGDNRLIHNPPDRWHRKGKLMVRRWIRHLSRG